MAAAELCRPAPVERYVFALLFGAVLVDATDGFFARLWNVHRYAARIDGRTIDDLVDYLTFTFLPLMLMARMEWLPEPVWLWIVPALIASLFGFANREAKDEAGGFFLGFPSYWNIVAFYAGLFHPTDAPAGSYLLAVAILFLALLTVLPVRFIYPTLAPAPWRIPILAGAGVWLLQLIALLVLYPSPPAWLTLSSLLYPAFYTAVSLYLAPPGFKSPGKG